MMLCFCVIGTHNTFCVLQTPIPEQILAEINASAQRLFRGDITRELEVFSELQRILENKDLEESVSVNTDMDRKPMRDALKYPYYFLDEDNRTHDFIYECLPVGLLTRSHYAHLLQV